MPNTPQPVVSTTKAAGHTGVMLAFFVPTSAIERVTALQKRLPNPEPAEDLHLTLAYLGDNTSLIEQRPYLEQMLGSIDWVAAGLPLAGRIGGIGRFHHDEGDGTNAVYASFDAPALPAFRQRLIEQLKMNGIMPAENHGFTPHITLAYVPVDQEVRTLAPAELPEVVFGALTLAWGDERIEFGPGARMKEASLTVLKDASGRYRWLTFSSTAFRDRDEEIVSTKALADDVARADADGAYGPLRWWHVPGLDIGDCDFNAMHGRTLIESGTFRDERYGPLVAAKAHELGVSIAYTHPASEPDAEKVFHRIKRFERSFLPLDYPSNLFTGLLVKEISTVDATKIAGLKALGFDDQMIVTIQEQAQAREKAGDAAGIAFKSVALKEAEVAPDIAPVEAAPVETPAVEAARLLTIADLTPDAFLALMRQAQQPQAEETATKEAATATALKAAQEQLTATVTRIGGLEQELTSAKSQVAALVSTVKELQGEVPAGVKRASQDQANIATKDQVEAFKGPAADPMNDFLGFVTGSAG